MVSKNKLQPFIEGDAQILARSAADGTIVGFDTEIDSEEVSAVMGEIQDEYDEFIKNLGDILYTNTGADRAYQFGRFLRSEVEQKNVTEDQLLQMVDFDEVSTEEARLFVNFAELYPDGDYPEDINPKIAGTLAEEYSAEKAREINESVRESEYRLTEAITDLWFDIPECNISTVCRHIDESKVKRPLDAAKLVYILDDKKPPSEEKIESHLPEPDVVTNESSSVDNALKMTKVSDDGKSTDTDCERESTPISELNNPTIEDFSRRVEVLREIYDGSRFDYELGSLVRELAEEHGIPVSEMAETDVIDFSYSYLNNYKHVVGPFSKDTFPSDISINDLYRLVTEYDDDVTARNRIMGATSFDSESIRSKTVDYFKSVDDVQLESASEQMSDTKLEEAASCIQVAHILDGKKPPSESEVYEAMGETPQGYSHEVDESSEDYQLDRGIPPAPKESNEQGVTGDTSNNQDTVTGNSGVSHKPKLKEELADSFIDTEYGETLLEHSEVTYQPETKTLVPSSPDVKQQITAEYGEFIPTESVVDAFSKGKTYLVATNDKSVHETLKSGENRFEIGEIIDPQQTDGTLYNGVKSYTHLPLIVSYPDNSGHVALAIETYANNGGENVVYIGEMSNNGETPWEVIQALHNNYTIEHIETGVQWNNSSDALYVFTKHTNTQDI